MYRYYQTDDKGPWVPIVQNQAAEASARQAGATKLTILSVSEIVDDAVTDKSALRYKGPFYADIDYKDDLDRAIDSARSMVRKLQALQVPDEAIEVACSGSKGLHVIVSEQVFSSGRPIKNLPLVYMEMALELWVPGLDFQPYCQGRGNSWRLINALRPDGRYRVPVSLEQLETLDQAQYLKLVAEPQPVPPVTDTKHLKAPALEALFNRALKRVRAKPRQMVAATQEELRQIREVPPNCARELAEYETTAESFNSAALQMAIYIVRSGTPPETTDTLVQRMAYQAKSDKATARGRQDHLESLLGYVKHNPGYKFSCSAMRSILKNRDACEGCPLQKTAQDLDSLDLQILEKSDGYYIAGVHSDRRISTFTLEAVDQYVEQVPEGGARRVGAVMNVLRQGNSIGQIRFNESSWNSKNSFVSELQGIANLSFIGGDSDVQRIKHIAFAEDREMGEIVQVYSAGVHEHRVADGRTVLCYVEPGLSINSLKVRGTHFLDGKIAAPPRLKDTDLPEDGDKAVVDAVLQLLQVNNQETVAQLLGWFASCHLKAHLMRSFHQFPLLTIWGSSGVGKTVTTSLFSSINGVDYSLNDSAINLSTITEWAMLDYCSSTTTVPRLLEEYNASKMSKKSYNMCGEVMKSGWNAHSMARGTLARSRANGRGRTGAQLVEIAISAPMVVLSEQAPVYPALQQRSVQLMLTKSGRLGRTEHFNKANRARPELLKIAKALMLFSLTTSQEWVEKTMDECESLVPSSIDDRPRYSYQVLLTGLEFFASACRNLRLYPLLEPLEELQQSLIYMLDTKADEIQKAKSRTEVDAVMEDMGTMAALSVDGAEVWLQHGKHYLVQDGKLFLDVPICHALYRKYKKHQRDAVTIDSPSQFAILLREEPYFDSETLIRKDMVASRPVTRLDLVKMAEKGLLTSMFLG